MAYTQEGIEKPKRLVKEYLDRQGVLRIAGNELGASSSSRRNSVNGKGRSSIHGCGSSQLRK